MSGFFILVCLPLLWALSFYMGKRKADYFQTAARAGGALSLHSRPHYHGAWLAVWCALPATIVALLWVAISPSVIRDIVMSALPIADLSIPAQDQLYYSIVSEANGETWRNDAVDLVTQGAAHYSNLSLIGSASMIVIVLSILMALLMIGRNKMSADFRARNHVEKVVQGVLMICSMIAILTTLGIILSLIFEAWRFFMQVPVTDFLFGVKWTPQGHIDYDADGNVIEAHTIFGAIPLFVGTLLISFIALIVAIFPGLFSAIYLSEYASASFRAWAKPVLEILAGIPTVVYGFFAALTVADMFKRGGLSLGLEVSPESALAAGVVMGVMLIPYISSLSDDVISSVPQALRDGSEGMGATRSETIRFVVLPAALPGIAASIILAASRAIGETMIVVMAAGLAANLTLNPLDSVSTVTVQMVTLLVGDIEFDSPKTLSTFALGLVLFVVTLILNVIALRIVNKYREKYD